MVCTTTPHPPPGRRETPNCARLHCKNKQTDTSDGVATASGKKPLIIIINNHKAVVSSGKLLPGCAGGRSGGSRPGQRRAAQRRAFPSAEPHLTAESGFTERRGTFHRGSFCRSAEKPQPVPRRAERAWRPLAGHRGGTAALGRAGNALPADYAPFKYHSPSPAVFFYLCSEGNRPRLAWLTRD